MREQIYGHLKLRHLQLLMLLDQEGTITQAAQTMHLTQPAVSAMLRELESIFGLRLVERSRRGVVLTAAAHAAMRRFRIALAEVDCAHDEAMMADRDARLRIRVGALTVAMLDLIPNALSRFVAAGKTVQFDFSEGTVDELSGRLFRGELDLVVGRLGVEWAKSPEGGQLAQTKLLDEPRCLVSCASHSLAGRRSTSIATLASQRWILQPAPSSSRRVFDEMFLLRGMAPPAPVIESASTHSNLDIVARTDLLTIAPLALARRHVEMGRLHRLPCAVSLTAMSISAIWRRTSESDELTMRFRDALVAAAAMRPRRAQPASRSTSRIAPSTSAG